MKITGRRIGLLIGEYIDCDHKVKRKYKKLINRNVRRRVGRLLHVTEGEQIGGGVDGHANLTDETTIIGD